MFIYDKKLQYPVKIDNPNPRLAAIIISQYGGPDGELGASLRYLSQRYSMPFDEAKGTNRNSPRNPTGFADENKNFCLEYCQLLVASRKYCVNRRDNGCRRPSGCSPEFR